MNSLKSELEKLGLVISKKKHKPGTKERRKNWLLKDSYSKFGDFLCHYCNVPVHKGFEEKHPRKATADHKVPVSLGGKWNKENLVLACRDCNDIKGALKYQFFRKVVVWKKYPILKSLLRPFLKFCHIRMLRGLNSRVFMIF